MHIIIIGAGEVGIHIAEFLSEARHSVVIVDEDAHKIDAVEETLDVQGLCGPGTDVAVLREAGAQGADLVLAVSNSDEVNFAAAQLAKRLGATRTMVRARKPFYLGSNLSVYSETFDVDRIVCPEVLTAEEIARLVEHPGSLEVTFLAGGRVQMRRFIAEPKTRGTGRPLLEVPFPPGTLVASICRDDHIIIPRGDDMVTPGDTVTVIGPTADIGTMYQLFHSKPEPLRSVVIAGAGLISQTLAKILEHRGFSVRIVDRDLDRCRAVAQQLSKTEVLHGDVTHLRFLEEERLGRADAFVAGTNNDETNLMSALLMKQLGVEDVTVIVHRPDFAPLLTMAGITHAFSPRFVMANTVNSALQRREITSVQLLEGGRAEVLEVRVPIGARITGTMLKDALIPRGCIVAAIIRRSDVLVPQGDDILMAGDTVVAYSLASVAMEVEHLLTRL